jgi:hypothetical protein
LLSVVVTVLFHLPDILFTLAGGFSNILWLVLLASLAHFALLGLVFTVSRGVKSESGQEAFVFGP